MSHVAIQLTDTPRVYSAVEENHSGPYGIPIRELPDLMRAGQVGSVPCDPYAGDDRDGRDAGTC